MELSTGIFDDARNWNALPLERNLPTRIVHGIRDETVPIQESRDFVTSHPWATLVELDSDHGLLSHIDWIVQDCLKFFAGNGLLTVDE